MKRRFAIIGGLGVLAVTYAYAYFFSGYPEAKELPLLTLYTLARISIVFLIATGFGVAVGVLAGTNRTVGRVIIPVFDVLQSIPVLGYFPLLLVTLVLAFPGLVGRELGSMVMLFTAMEWSIFFGVVGAIKGVPYTVQEAARGFGLKGRSYFRNIIAPAIVPALLSASTLAWNDGWTFDVVSEFASYGNVQYAVSGLGSFIERASSGLYPDLAAAWLGLLVMGEVVIITNQLIWHPLSDKVAKHSAHLGLHVPERIFHPFRAAAGQRRRVFGLRFRVELLNRARVKYGFSTKLMAGVFLAGLAIIAGTFTLSDVVPEFSVVGDALEGLNLAALPIDALLTLARMTVVYLGCLLLSLAVALYVTQRRSATKYFYAVYDVGRAVPYLALFPPLFATLVAFLPGGVGLEISSFFLLFMGMIWYILFNVVTAATFLPTELKEVSAVFGLRGWAMVRHVMMPAILPAIITGSILAWGGGWNVVIYSEYAKVGGKVYSMPGLGSLLDQAASSGNSALVVVYLFMISGIVILLGRLVWRRLLNKVEKRGLELS
ncbi:MAG: ABC transporter permease subunit [Thaumarchaeota archaeon]|nr:ABC transporter permease subunit [Nitrososphaerota archaeon]